MSDVNTVVSFLRGEVERAQAFSQAADLLTEFGIVEKAIVDGRAALEIVRGDHDKAKADLDALRVEIKTTLADIDAREKASRERIAVSERQAAESANSLVARAKEQAKEIMDKALATAASVELEHKNKMDAAEARLSDALARVKGLKDEAQAIDKRIKEMREAAGKIELLGRAVMALRP